MDKLIPVTSQIREAVEPGAEELQDRSFSELEFKFPVKGLCRDESREYGGLGPRVFRGLEN